MTATSAGSSNSSSSHPAKGLDISLAALQRQDPYINDIVDVASQVALYTYNNRANEWEKTEVEGTLFIYTRLASPRHGFTIMNRLSMENLTEPITKDLDFQLQHPFLLYRNARLVIHGIWFYDKEDCQRIAQRMKILTQQEQTLAQSQGGWLSPGAGGRGVVGGGGGGGGHRGGGGGGHRAPAVVGGASDAKGIDIIQMLTKARTAYDKSTSEPKEIGGSSVLCGNPNLIKPIPVKPTTQDSEGAELKPLSLATLFGSQHQPSTVPSSAPAPGAEPSVRPPVARTLTYEDTLNHGNRSVAAQGGNVAMVQGSNTGPRGAADGLNVGMGLLPTPATTTHHQHQQPQMPTAVSHNQPRVHPNQPQPQHCAAFQKLMEGQRAAVAGGVLQSVSESPESRLCDNGVPLEHHLHLQYQQQQQQQRLLHHYNHLQQHHLHHHHHHHQQQQQQALQAGDPIQRLFQTQPPMPVFTSSVAPPPPPPPPHPPNPPCPSIPPPSLQQSPHPIGQQLMVDSVPCSHLQAQPSQQLFLGLSNPQPEPHQQQQQALSVVQATGLVPSQLTKDQVLQPTQGVSSLMPGVAPQELLQKLQLVQQEQSHAPHDPPRLCPGLAPRFLGPAQGQGVGSAGGTMANQTGATVGQKAALQFQVISPQRIPATVAPNLLLSPSVFTQAKPSSGGFSSSSAAAAAFPEHPSSFSRPPPKDETTVLSKSQLQGTLLHLIQTDSSFLDTIYEAYVSRYATEPGCKY